VAAVVNVARRDGVKRAVKWGVVALILIFLGSALRSAWATIAGHHWQIAWPVLGGGFLFLLGQELSFGFIWRVILGRMGYRLPWRICLRIFLAAEFVRYIPGNVWHVLTRVIWAEREGVPKSFGLASMTVELATRIAAGVLTFAVSLIWWPDLTRLGSGLGHFASLALVIVGVPLLILGLHPRVLQWGLNLALRALKRKSITLTLTYGDILAVVGAWTASWIIGGVGFWLAVLAVTPAGLSLSTMFIAIGIYAMGWTIGFLSFVTPSGLFFREAVVALLLSLSGVVPNIAIAGVVAVLASRLMPTLAELLCVGWAYWATRRHHMPARQALVAVPDQILQQSHIRVRATRVRHP
ncbi:MAG TPA: lysylphosphatidylglycerol synthase domain-containing protein, partial [Ktedonobacterales bacterium]|nr:lysylphosphatidylglycerol synthase domain-containing protein [Ktedonobacterales bacterium]